MASPWQQNRIFWLAWIVALLGYTSVTGVQQVTNPRIIEHPEDQYVAKNEPATLNCKAEGDPQPVITWYRNGQPVITANENPSSHRMLLPSGQLFFLRVIHNKNNKPDVGEYHCMATNPRTKVSVASRNATLDIAVIRDDFKTEPSSQEVGTGDTAILECRPPKGQPEPRIKWTKNGNQIHPDRRVTIHESGNLIIQDVTKNDIGSYVCIAHNIAGEKQSRLARLDVKDKPRFTKEPQDVLVEENENVRFECAARGDPPPTIIWRREDGAIPQGRSSILEDRSLRIERVKVHDEGTYICRAENNVGHVEAPARLTIHSHPKFLVTPSDKVVGVGRAVSLRCSVHGNPPPNVFWNKDTGQILMFPRQDYGRFSVTDDGTLIIEPVRKEDQGEYVCQALNVAGTAFAKARITVKDVDPRPPPIIHQGPQNQTLPVNSVAMLQCHSSGDPPPTIRWHKNGRPLSTRDPRVALLDSGTLQISDLRGGDSGLYTCKAISETGETTWTAALTVEAPTNPSVIFHRTPEPSTFPGPPSKPMVTDITETTMKLAWKANGNHGASPVVAYTVEYFSHETGEGWIVASDSVRDQDLVVRHLRPDTSYMFLVRAQNSHGLSLPSQVAGPFRTRGGSGVRPTLQQFDIGVVHSKLTGQVLHLKQPIVISSTAIQLNWEVLKSQRYIEGFHLKYRVMPDLFHQGKGRNHHHVDYTIETITPSTANMYVLRNLRKYTWYEIRVQPFYLTVEGQESNTARVRTREDVPSASPRNIRARLLENNTLHLSWQPPPKDHHNGPLKGYKIFCIGNETKFDRNITTNESTHAILIHHLARGVNYRIQIAAFNKVNGGAPGMRSKPLIIGDGATRGLMQGFVKEPWFIATLIGTIGGTLWFALCVFSIWLYRKKKARKKLHKNGVMTVPVHKTDDPAREIRLRTTQPLLGPTAPPVDALRPDVANVTRGSAAAQRKDADVKENLYNTPSIQTPPMKTFYNKSTVGPYATTTLIAGNNMLNKADSAFRPIQKGFTQQGSNGSSDSCMKQDVSTDSNSDNANLLPPHHYSEHVHTGYYSHPEALTPPAMSEYGPIYGGSLGYASADEMKARGLHQGPVLFLPPPPEHPPPSDIGTPPDSPQAERHHGGNNGVPHPFPVPGGVMMSGSLRHPKDGLPSYHQVVPHSDSEYASAHHAQSMHNRSYSPSQRPRGINTSEDMRSAADRCRTMSPQAQLERAYSPRAMSEPECPNPPRRHYKLVPLTDQEMEVVYQQRHLSDTEGAPLPPLRGMSNHHPQPPSPAPEDALLQDYTGELGLDPSLYNGMSDYPPGPMMDSACQSSLPSLVSEAGIVGGGGGRTRLEMTPNGPQLVTRSDSPPSEYDAIDSDVDMKGAGDCVQNGNGDGSEGRGSDGVTGSMMAGWASVTDNSSCGSNRSSALSSSDGEFLAEADFASAVAKAAELSGLTVVGSTISGDPSAISGARNGAPVRAPDEREKVRKKHRERAKRPTSPYSTDSNYSTVQVPHKPYPKSDRKRQLQQYGGRRGAGSDSGDPTAPRSGGPAGVKGTPPPVKAKPPHGVPQNGRLVMPPGGVGFMQPGVSDMPSYNKPSFPSPTANQSNGFVHNGGTPVPKQRTTLSGKLATSSSPDYGSIRTNPLTAAFDTSDTPIV